MLRKLRFIAKLLHHPSAFIHPMYVDLEQPHDCACRKHRNLLKRPAFTDGSWRLFALRRGLKVCEVE